MSDRTHYHSAHHILSILTSSLDLLMNPNSKLVSKVDITNNRILYTVGKVPQPSGPTQSPTNFGLGKKFMFQINSLATNDPTAKSNKIEGSCGTNQFNLALEHSSRNVVLITGKAEKALAGQFPQRAVIGSIFGQHAPGFSKTTLDPRLYLNVNTPFSALICGIQGSGKSHSASVILEGCSLVERTIDRT
ncbi:hypothetical protein Pst134EA_006800 [Puccinia striiformis f. sp. tritici]|uniref:hypothetical protein n=1 Tax=Puccinia striiformis f. sp. tritici TaxID=168172 RepID=UPI002008644E|nr:hypothetical protein Pst134EA_006800 [Puccinia striiformis f. sp. tritici]KAH9469508.1 hypothetical protein Pst134EA_006800 [Puccinia striiformis f. sp. tritici]